MSNPGGDQENQIQDDLASYKPSLVYSRRLRNPHPYLLSNLEIRPDTETMEDDGDVEMMTSNRFNDLDIPIALRKMVKSCTKHPISNYLGYSNLSPQFKAFIASIDDIVIPRNIYHTLQDEKWKTTVMDDM